MSWALAGVCKKSFQAMVVADLRPVSSRVLRQSSIAQLQTLSPGKERELEWGGRADGPFYAGPRADPHYRPVTLGLRFGRASFAIRSAPQKNVFFYCSGGRRTKPVFLLATLAPYTSPFVS